MTQRRNFHSATVPHWSSHATHSLNCPSVQIPAAKKSSTTVIYGKQNLTDAHCSGPKPRVSQSSIAGHRSTGLRQSRDSLTTASRAICVSPVRKQSHKATSRGHPAHARPQEQPRRVRQVKRRRGRPAKDPSRFREPADGAGNVHRSGNFPCQRYEQGSSCRSDRTCQAPRDRLCP